MNQLSPRAFAAGVIPSLRDTPHVSRAASSVTTGRSVLDVAVEDTAVPPH